MIEIKTKRHYKFIESELKKKREGQPHRLKNETIEELEEALAAVCFADLPYDKLPDRAKAARMVNQAEAKLRRAREAAARKVRQAPDAKMWPVKGQPDRAA